MKPIDKIPDNMWHEFTMDGMIDVEYKYRDDSTALVQAQILNNFTKESFDRFSGLASKKKRLYYKSTDGWLYEALKKHDVYDADVCVFGSACPWYEIIFIQHGARMVDVLEFSSRASYHNKISYCKRNELTQYDVAVSISSFEHYGLGRYGDPIDPWGDFKAMDDVRDVLTHDGILFLSLPIGKDKICFNVHRIYGRHRFYALIDGFEIIDSFGFKEKDFDRTDNGVKGTPYQPLFILRKK